MVIRSDPSRAENRFKALINGVVISGTTREEGQINNKKIMLWREL